MTRDNKPLLTEIQEYIRTEVALLKLNVLEKFARILAFVVGIIMASVLSLISIAYFSVMLFDIFASLTGSSIWATVIMIVIFLLLSILIFVFSEKLFLNFFIRKIYNVLFSDSPQKSESKEQSGVNHDIPLT